MQILAFGHQKNVGKDTLAQQVLTLAKSQRPDLQIVKVGFADLLKSMCHRLYGWAGLQPGYAYEDGPGRVRKEMQLATLGKSPRQIWIEVGNKLREVYEDTWIDAVLNGIQADVLLISDLRYPNEAAKIKARGGRIIKVTRPGLPPSHDIADDALLDYNAWDAVVINNGTLEDLYYAAEKLWTALSVAPTAACFV